MTASSPGPSDVAGHTPLFDAHVRARARMVPFAGWEMPLHYGSQVAEHHAVRTDAGMFDVSHMTVTDVSGKDARAFLRHVVANDVERLADVGKALYGALLNEDGGVVDDVIVYRLTGRYRVVSNAGTHDRVVPWLSERAGAFDVALTERRDLAMLAVQGPLALTRFRAATGRGEAEGLAAFDACEAGDWMIGRTGYTGEDGIEVLVPAEGAEPLWESLLEAGVAPAGLGARDTLRLEAGLNLHGQDMDESVTPLESNMAWTVAWDPPERRLRRAGRAGGPPRSGIAGEADRDRPGGAGRPASGHGRADRGGRGRLDERRVLADVGLWHRPRPAAPAGQGRGAYRSARRRARGPDRAPAVRPPGQARGRVTGHGVLSATRWCRVLPIG